MDTAQDQSHGQLIRISPNRIRKQVTHTVRYRPIRSLLFLGLLVIVSLFVLFTLSQMAVVQHTMIAHLEGRAGAGVGVMSAGGGGGGGRGGRRQQRGWRSQFNQFKIEPLLVRNAPSVEVNSALAANRRLANKVAAIIVRNSLLVTHSAHSHTSKTLSHTHINSSNPDRNSHSQTEIQTDRRGQTDGETDRNNRKTDSENNSGRKIEKGERKTRSRGPVFILPRAKSKCRNQRHLNESLCANSASISSLATGPKKTRNGEISASLAKGPKKTRNGEMSGASLAKGPKKTRNGEMSSASLAKGPKKTRNGEMSGASLATGTQKTEYPKMSSTSLVTVPQNGEISEGPTLGDSKIDKDEIIEDKIDKYVNISFVDENNNNTETYEPIDSSDLGLSSFAIPKGKSRRRLQGKILSEEQLRKLPLCPEIPPGLMGHLKMDLDALKKVKLSEVKKQLSWVDAGGTWSPILDPDSPCLPRHKVAVIVPYRDRLHHLVILLSWLHPILRRQQLHYTIYVAEQAGNMTFNKGSIMNAGFMEAWQRSEASCFVFHDVDLLPEDDRNMYSCPPQPRHLSVGVDTLGYKLPYFLLVGGVFSLRGDHFLQLNGYSNMYWGWGGEDDDMGYRINQSGLSIIRPPNNISKYTMIRHRQRRPLAWKIRGKLLRTSGRRYRLDGLNTLRYSLLSLHRHTLFTHLLLDVGTPPENLVKLDAH